MEYQAGDWVWWRTPSNVDMETHGVNPNTVVRVQLQSGMDDYGVYDTGRVSVRPDEIIGRA